MRALSQRRRPTAWACVLVACCGLFGSTALGDGSVALPDGVKAVWDLDGAYRQNTQTRERLCINGLWRWQPAVQDGEAAPPRQWGFFKVPGPWPGINSYIQKDSQTLYSHPSWGEANLRGLTSAWYQREIGIPPTWAGRRITLNVEYLNSHFWKLGT